MPMSNYPEGFPEGVLIRGVPINNFHKGEIFYVDGSSVLGANQGSGGANTGKGTYKQPFATIDYAIGRCTADRGDIIVVMPGHTEDITAAGGIDIDVDGVSIIGVGRGDVQPRIDFNNAAASVDRDWET